MKLGRGAKNIGGGNIDKLPKYDLIRREDGRIERLCKHGIGHTVGAPESYKKAVGIMWDLHGCDGCCYGWEYVQV